jgi:hypothetical protein
MSHCTCTNGVQLYHLVSTMCTKRSFVMLRASFMLGASLLMTWVTTLPPAMS